MMRKLLWIVLSLLFCSFETFLYAQKGDVAAIVTQFTGKFLIKPAEEENFVPAKMGQFLREGDVVKTEENSLAAITFVTGVQIKINEKTQFKINQKGLGKLEEAITMNEGEVYSKVLKRGSNFEVQTNAAVASVRGTEFNVEVKPPRKKKIKIKVRRSKILEKGLAEIVRAYKEAYEKEAKERLALRELELQLKLEKERSKKSESEIRLVEIRNEKERQEKIFKKAEAEREKAEKIMKRAEKDLKRKTQNKYVEEEKEFESLVQEQFVSVLEGRVDLLNDFGRVSVNAGQRGSVTEGEAPQPPQEMRVADRPVWQERVHLEEKNQFEIDAKLLESGLTPLSIRPELEIKNLILEVETPAGKKILNLQYNRRAK